MTLPVILVTGFLGSGKTTFLHHIATQHPQHRLVFLVNELADTGLDGESISRSGRPAHSVVGGSLFCECKAAEFVRTMRETVLDSHRSQPLDAVIIETSGIADPEAIGSLMHDHGLDQHFHVAHIVTLAAPPRFATLLRNLDVIAAQIRTSDTVILNKCDLSTEEQISSAEHAIRQLQPAAHILRASFSRVEPALFTSSERTSLPAAPLATCEANPFSTITLDASRPLPMAQLRAWVRELPATVLRAKGVMPTDAGWCSLEKTVDSCHYESVSPCPHARLVVIVHDDHAADLDPIAASFHALGNRTAT